MMQHARRNGLPRPQVEPPPVPQLAAHLEAQPDPMRPFPVGARVPLHIMSGDDLPAEFDVGDPHNKCPYCRALLFDVELNQTKHAKTKTKYGLCCSNGKIVLPTRTAPPKMLNDLMSNKNDSRTKMFRKFGRHYNNACQFVSMQWNNDPGTIQQFGPQSDIRIQVRTRVCVCHVCARAVALLSGTLFGSEILCGLAVEFAHPISEF